MDPVAIGVVLSSVITPLAKQLLAHPETVAKGVDWVWSAAEHFLKMRRGQVDADDPAPLPPESEPAPDAAGKDVQTPSPPRVKRDLDQLKLDLLEKQVDSEMKLVTQYVGNLQTLSQQAAQYGGEEFAPLVMVNQIKNQRRSIVEHLNELAGLMSDVYEVQVEGVDELAAIADAS